MLRDFLNSCLQYDFDYESDYDKKANEKVCNVCFELNCFSPAINAFKKPSWALLNVSMLFRKSRLNWSINKL